MEGSGVADKVTVGFLDQLSSTSTYFHMKLVAIWCRLVVVHMQDQELFQQTPQTGKSPLPLPSTIGLCIDDPFLP